SASPRRLLLLQFVAIDAWPLTSIGTWDAFNSNILRGEPIHCPRMTATPVRMPYPPAERLGSIYEIQTVLEQPIFARKAG
ncbi:MAG: phytanoyl-CoA dioxygenase family protein, partial [candidate division Zixibacteria bacterium]|nr:phytanoyl-CoA dioxygenase family protein [candidate division Zixibacteria bacterium]